MPFLGLVYQHPLLPKPLLAFEPTVPVDISLFESGNEFKEIKASMIRCDFYTDFLIFKPFSPI